MTDQTARPSTGEAARPSGLLRTHGDEPADARPDADAAPTSASPPGGDSTTAAAEPGPVDGTDTGPASDATPSTHHAAPLGHRRARRWPTVVSIVLLVLLLAAAVVGAVHLYQTSQAWQDRAEQYLGVATELGEDLAATQRDLVGAQAEIEAVRAQLTTAQARIVELADEKAQLGDDREVQRQLVDYQARVSEAAGEVALALDECVQGQNQLIGYMADADSYDPQELEQFTTDVQALCDAATEANIALQRELAR